MNKKVITDIYRRIKIWWNTPGYYSIVNGMPTIYESKEELQELLEEIKAESIKRKRITKDE